MANIDPAPSWANIRRLETTDRNMAGPGGILNDPTTSIAARLNLLRDNDTTLGNSISAVTARQDAADNTIATIQGQVLNAPGTLGDLDRAAPISVTGDQFPDVLSVYNSRGPVLALNESIADLSRRDEFLRIMVDSASTSLVELKSELGTAAYSSASEFATAAQGNQISQIQIEVDGIDTRIDAIEAGQSTSALYFDDFIQMNEVSGSFVGQGAFVLNGAGSGQYRWTGTIWEFLRADMLSLKADKSVIDPLVPVVKRLDAAYPNLDFGNFSYLWVSPGDFSYSGLKVAGGIQADGTLQFNSAKFTTATVDSLSVINNIDGNLRAYPSVALHGYVHNIFDQDNRAAGGIKDDGTLVFRAAEFDQLNGTDFNQVLDTLPGIGPNFMADVNVVGNLGQSLAQGIAPAITTTQQYDTIGFPARSTSPTAWEPATAATVSLGGTLEIPSFGATDCVKNLILAEDGISYTQQSYQFLIVNCAYAGYTIAQLEKGSVPYAQSISEIEAGYNIAQSQGKSFGVSAMFWVQGEADYTRTQGYYLDRIVNLQKDYQSDSQIITGQSYPVPMIISQTTSQGPVAYSRSVQLAVIEAQYKSRNIVVSAPQYMYAYVDDGFNVHVNSQGTRLIGAFMGLAHKRTVVDGKRWVGLLPVSANKQGRILYLKFNKTGITIDTTLVPAQPNYGISIRTMTGVDHPISSISVAQPDTLRIVCGATIPDGSELWLGGINAVGIANYFGGATNIRDNQGDTLKFDSYPLHNWALLTKIMVN